MDWSKFRSHFPVTKRWAFFDHAAVSPLPDTAIAAVEEYSRNMTENGVADIMRWVDRYATVRELARRMVNAPSIEDITFVPSTTMGINFIAEGFPWQAGDNVILASEEYPSNQYPWMNQQYRGVEVRSVKSRGNRVEVDDLVAAMDDRTRVLAISYVEFASGFRNDLDRLGEACRERNIFFFVDAIQGLGAFPLDVQKTLIDALAADGHKWMLGPEGAGFAYIRREWVERLHPIGVGSSSVVNPLDYSHIDFTLKPHAGRWEGGAMNTPGLTMMGESLQLLLDAGIENVSKRILELTDQLCDKTLSAGLTVFSSRDGNDRSGIVSIIAPNGIDPKEMVQRCRDAGVIINARGGRLRVSPHAYNIEAEIDQLIDVLT